VANPVPTTDDPVVQRPVLLIRSLWVSQAKEVALRPTVALAVLDCLICQAIHRLCVPRLERGAETTTPAAEALHVLREVEEVRAGARHFQQRLERCLARCWVTLCRRQCERKQRRIVFRCTAGARNLDDSADHARTIRLDHAQEGLCVLERQLALADVERAALGTERDEPVESLPVAHLPGEAAGAVRHLVGAEDLLM